MKVGRILLTHQLFNPRYIEEPNHSVVVSDHMWLLEEKSFNKLTILHRILSSNLYAKENDYHRTSIFLGDEHPFQSACRWMKSKGITEVKMFDPLDKPLLKSIEQISKKNKIKLIIEDTPGFAETHEDLNNFLKEHPPSKKGGINKYSHSVFYGWQRKRLNLLWNKKKDSPIGGKLSFDIENREPFPPNIKTDPTEYKPQHSSVGGLDDVSKIVDFIEKRYPKNPGYLKRGDEDNIKDIIERLSLYPLTNKEALGRLKIFIRKMLPKFGRYEDAFQPGVSFGFHSVLSSSLNNGLITPREILEEIGDIKPSKKLLPSLEGFIRQVFGWRSYCRLVYREERDVMMRSNYLSHKIKLPKNWFEYPSGKGSEGITKIGWLDSLLRDAQDRAYAHHIVRLMVFSNWFLLNQYHPRDVLDWFWSVVSIDAYEWVMVPNVLGMGQYADGGIMMTRPYISSSSYLLTMSRGVIKTGGQGPSSSGGETSSVKEEGGLKYSWEEIWGALFYEFLKKHKNSVGKMYAYARSMAYLRKVSPIKQREWKKIIKYYYSVIKGGKGSKLKDKKEDKKEEYSKGV